MDIGINQRRNAIDVSIPIFSGGENLPRMITLPSPVLTSPLIPLPDIDDLPPLENVLPPLPNDILPNDLLPPLPTLYNEPLPNTSRANIQPPPLPPRSNSVPPSRANRRRSTEDELHRRRIRNAIGFMMDLEDMIDQHMYEQGLRQSMEDSQAHEKKEDCRIKIEQMGQYSSVKQTYSLEKKCPVCLKKFKSKDNIGVLMCSHGFHYTCIKEWGMYNPKCPICRADIPTSTTVTTATTSFS